MMQDDVTSMLQPVAFSSLLYDHVVLIFYTQRVSKDDEENSMIHVVRVTQSICTDGLSIHEEALKKKNHAYSCGASSCSPSVESSVVFFSALSCAAIIDIASSPSLGM